MEEGKAVQCVLRHHQPSIIHSFITFTFFLSLLCFSLFPVAQTCQTNQSKKVSLLSQLALSSQNKFFLRSPPKSRRNASPAPPPGPQELGAGRKQRPDPDLDAGTETNRSLSPSGTDEPCLSAGLENAMCDLISLDSQTEVDEGTPS